MDEDTEQSDDVLSEEDVESDVESNVEIEEERIKIFFHVGTDSFNLSFLYDFLYFSMHSKCRDLIEQ